MCSLGGLRCLSHRGPKGWIPCSKFEADVHTAQVAVVIRDAASTSIYLSG